MKKIYLSITLALLATAGFAQTKIGVVGNSNPDVNTNAVLELDAINKGLLLPRVELTKTTEATPLNAHVEGMTVYNTKKQNDVVPGFYYNDGLKWQQMVTTDNKAVKFFYMPSIVFDTSIITDPATVKEVNLYQEYVNQFGMKDKSRTFKNDGAPESIPYFHSADQLDYYVTDYDPTVFEIVNISNEGIMQYRILSNGTPTSIMNIVFSVK
ncbi:MULTISPECIES: hypothetical protein [Myroides]|uniref:Uncharacterized protein n=1 Tax=Myroides albus TaxID=2562892 RepID=A0A6I3LM68_9FLAO|nr:MULTISPECIES: hypothetical protein [Myroides]MTG97661.1 hypothetical protein [Myroides albus]MVX34380.1 hypothetical protein [Myroides sp. LoEW2-1]UVD79289.1 hypothetical protein NWE55_14315 [Myroides albus]